MAARPISTEGRDDTENMPNLGAGGKIINFPNEYVFHKSMKHLFMDEHFQIKITFSFRNAIYYFHYNTN